MTSGIIKITKNKRKSAKICAKKGEAYYEKKVNFVHFGLNNGSKPAGRLWLK
jgi:hypothetical protein